MTTLREVERIDKESAARRPRPKRERLTPALPWPKLSPMCPALFAALITWPTKLFARLAPWLPWRIRPGRTWMSSSRVLMTLDIRKKRLTARGPLKLLRFVPQAPAGAVGAVATMSRPTNHMRATEVGAFPLPSVARIPPLPLPHVRTRDNPRQSAIKRDRNHCDLISLARRTNRLPNCGTRADKSTMARTLGGRSGRIPGDERSYEELLAVRTTKSRERAGESDFATATIFRTTRSTPIIGASVATYVCVSSGSARPV